jgi:hypothetical protein
MQVAVATANNDATAPSEPGGSGNVALGAAFGEDSAATAAKAASAVLQPLRYVHGRLVRDVRRKLKKKLWHWNRSDEAIAEDARKAEEEKKRLAQEEEWFCADLDEEREFILWLRAEPEMPKEGKEVNGADGGGQDADEKKREGREQLKRGAGEGEVAVHDSTVESDAATDACEGGQLKD